MQAIIEDNRERIAELCRSHHVRRLSVFGSAAREDIDPERSDVDLLVEFEDLPYPASIENSGSLEDALNALLGRPIDLVQPKLVRNPYIRETIAEDRRTLYAA